MVRVVGASVPLAWSSEVVPTPLVRGSQRRTSAPQLEASRCALLRFLAAGSSTFVSLDDSFAAAPPADDSRAEGRCPHPRSPRYRPLCRHLHPPSPPVLFARLRIELGQWCARDAVEPHASLGNVDVGLSRDRHRHRHRRRHWLWHRHRLLRLMEIIRRNPLLDRGQLLHLWRGDGGAATLFFMTMKKTMPQQQTEMRKTPPPTLIPMIASNESLLSAGLGRQHL